MTDPFVLVALSPRPVAQDPVAARALDPYRAKNCVYLREVDVAVVEGVLSGRGRFAIDESCYIDDTGHFNAAEFVICYNQLMYVCLAKAIESGAVPEFRGWTLADFWERQLPDVLIHEMSSTFSRPIAAAEFEGVFTIDQIGTRSLSRGMLTLATSVSFRDPSGGRARGTVRLALVNVPDRSRAPL